MSKLSRSIVSLTRHSAVYSISTFIQRALGLVMLPVYTDAAYLASKSDYGDYTLVYTFMGFMNILYLYGIDAAFLRYFFLGKHNKNDVYRSAIQILSITSLLSSGLVFIFSGPISELVFNAPGYDFFIKIAAGILLTDSLCSLPYLILRAEEKSVHYTLIRTGRFLVELIFNIIFVIVLKYGVKGILYANITAALINLIVLIPFQIKYISKGHFQKDAVKDLLRFGLPMLPNGIAYLTVEISDRFLVPRFLDKNILGLYSANYRFGTILLLFVIAFRTAWQPFFLKHAQDKDARELFSKIMTYFCMVSAWIVIGGSLLIDYIVRVPIAPGKTLMGSMYWEGTFIIPVILFSYLLYGMYVNLTVGIYIEHKSQYMVIFTGLAALTNIICNVLLLPVIGMTGAAFATFFAYFVMAVSIYSANRKIYPVKYDYGKLTLIFLYLLATLAVFYIYQPGFIIRLILITAYPVFVIVTGIFDKEEQKYLKNIIQKRL